MKEDDSTAPGPRGRLNEYQARRLRVACHYIDKLLCEIEGMLEASSSKAAFPRYSADIGTEQHQPIEDYIARIRSKLIRVLSDQGMAKEPASIPASHAIHVALGTIDIAVEELKPGYMRGYGEVPEAAAAELNEIVGELRALVSQLDHYVADSCQETVRHARKGQVR